MSQHFVKERLKLNKFSNLNSFKSNQNKNISVVVLAMLFFILAFSKKMQNLLKSSELKLPVRQSVSYWNFAWTSYPS